MGTRTGYAPGTFCWVDLSTSDPEAAKAFYAELFGWAVPEGMVEAVVDTETGLLAGEWCESTRREHFKPGTEPTEYADCEPEYYEDDDEWLWDVRQRIARTLKGIIRF